MILANLWKLLETDLFPLEYGNCKERNLFNPYHDTDERFDLPNAVHIRRQNLFRYLDSFTVCPDVLFVGEAPGWKGCRFSGIPFTSEQQVCSGLMGFVGKQSSIGVRPLRELTANYFWKAVFPHRSRILAWNCLPLHPHCVGNPTSNRPPTAKEIRDFGTLLQTVIESIGECQIVAVGKKAAGALDMIGSRYCQVRHPSYGGANQFRDQTTRILD